MLSFEQVVNRADELNSLCECKHLASRFKLIENTERLELGKYSLLLGSSEQFGYGTRQTELLRTDNLDEIKYDLDTVTYVLEFESLHGNI